jgi:hypothetical protein
VSEPVQQRSAERAALESAAGHVSDVLLNLEHTLARAKKARKLIAKDGIDTNALLALDQAIVELERVRKRLQQDTYFAGDSLRLI